VKETGPVVHSILVAALAPGCRYLTREIRLVEGLNRIDLINIIDKTNVYNPEAVHIAFPFEVPGGTLRYGLAYGNCRLEVDQLPGANRNFITATDWVDISNSECGVTVTLPETPIFEAGAITMDEIVYGYVDRIEPTQTFYSYIMNNYWETNYKASQEGPFVFQYSILPHKVLNLPDAVKAGIASRQPLIAVRVSADLQPLVPLLNWNNPDVIATGFRPAPDKEGIIVTLFNPGEQEERMDINCKGLYLSNLNGDRLKKMNKAITLKGFEGVSLIVY
jgi:hypothetical protein